MSLRSFLFGKSPRRMGGTGHVLVDSSTYAVLAVSNNTAIIAFLSEWTTDVRSVWAATYPVYPRGFFLFNTPMHEYPEWTWSDKTRMFTPTLASTLTPALRAKSELAASKALVISSIILSINLIRNPLQTGFQLQELIYTTKRLQAEAFRDAAYNEDHAIEYPYILQYADFAGISLKQAADEILFKAKLDDVFLAKTEGLRLKYLDRVRRTTDPKELPTIKEEFMRDCLRAQIT